MSNHIDAQTPVGSAVVVNEPTVLGAFGLALSCLCLGLELTFPFAGSAPLIGLGLVVGGIGQLLASLTAWYRGREMTSIAFCAAGLFFLSLLSVLLFPELGLGTTPDRVAQGSYLFMWALFFVLMTPGLRQHCPTFALPTATAMQGIGLALHATALLTGHAVLTIASGMIFLGVAVVTSLSVLSDIFHDHPENPR